MIVGAAGKIFSKEHFLYTTFIGLHTRQDNPALRPAAAQVCDTMEYFILLCLNLSHLYLLSHIFINF